MMSLFSSFDLGLPMLNFTILFFLLSNIFNFIYKKSISEKTLTILKNSMENFFLTMKKKSFNKTISFMLFLSFLMILILNFTSILSYNFAYTTQLSVLMYISLSMWLGLMMFSALKSTKYFLAHCIPEGTPIYLVWFLLLIELISNMIRPLTVTVRLLANITAGHLLMILLHKLVENYPLASFAYMGLNLAEMMVALIQSYIYATMICLYYSEVK